MVWSRDSFQARAFNEPCGTRCPAVPDGKVTFPCSLRPEEKNGRNGTHGIAPPRFPLTPICRTAPIVIRHRRAKRRRMIYMFMEAARRLSRRLLPNHFYQHAFSPIAVKFAVIDLLPRAEIELAFGDGYDDFAAHDLSF